MHRYAPGLCSLLALCALMLIGCDKHSAEKEAVRDAYDRYLAAIAARDGAAAASLVSVDSLRDNERTTRLSLTASKAAVQAMPISDRFEVFLNRHLAAGDKSVIKKLGELKGADLFAYQVKLGWGLDDPTTKIRLGRIRITKTGAEADVIVDGEKDAIPTYFVLEDGRWLRDLTQHQRFDRYFAAQARKEKLEENLMIMLVIEEMTGRFPDEDEVWKPLSPSGGGSSGLYDP